MRQVAISRVVRSYFLFNVLGVLLLLGLPGTAGADSTYQTLPFTQDWTNTGLITANDDWSGVPGIIGFRGDGLTVSTGADPQTVLAPGTGVVDVNANQADTTLTSGGVGEFELADPVVGLQGSGTADAPHLLLHVNGTGQAAITVSYTVRDIDVNDDAVQPVAMQYRIGESGNFTNLPGAFVADGTTGPGMATLTTAVSATLPAAADNQPQIQVRIITTNASGSDEWVGIDDIVVTGGGGGNGLTIADVSVNEGDAGTTTAMFTVQLSDPAPAGGVTFDIATSDDTATTADSDYLANSQVSQMIGAGSQQYVFNVTVNGDVNVEPDETFFVDVSNVVGTDVVVIDGHAVGTIVSEETPPPPTREIFEIQGSGPASPFDGQAVTTSANVVTAVGPEGFFLQTPDARDDLDDDTSNGIYVFTFTPPTVAVGDLIDMEAEVQEFFEFTELINPVISIIGTSPLPAAIALDASTPSPDPAMPSCAIEYECIEGMLVTVTDGVVGSGNLSFASDPTAEVAITVGGARAFREPGIEFPGLGGSIPTWDGNPESFELDADALGLPTIEINGGATFTATGAIAYEFGDYELWPSALTVTDVTLPDPVPVKAADEVAIGSLNLFRFFDNIDDPGDDQVVSLAEYERRRSKFAMYVLDVLLAPDILCVQEAEKLAVLQALADDIFALDPTVVYSPVLVEGNDVGGIDVGFLVRDTVTIDNTTQLGAAEILTFDGSLLHDRPPLLLEATYTGAGASLELALMAVHMRSLGGIDDPTNGPRVRQKRLEQAQSLAQKVQDFQEAEVAAAGPDRPLIVLGDFNAFEFTDGYVDLLGQVIGFVDPSANLLSDTELVLPNLTDPALSLPQDERYSFIFRGSAQTLDHALVTRAGRHIIRDFVYGRGNADAPRILLDDETTAQRSSDHDGFVLYLADDLGVDLFTDGFESGDVSAWSQVVP